MARSSSDNESMNIFGMGPLELGLVAALALVVFGPDKLPELARQVGRVLGDIRRVSSDASAELQRSMRIDEPGVIRPRQPIGGLRKNPDEGSDKSTPPDAPLPPY